MVGPIVSRYLNTDFCARTTSIELSLHVARLVGVVFLKQLVTEPLKMLQRSKPRNTEQVQFILRLVQERFLLIYHDCNSVSVAFLITVRFTKKEHSRSEGAWLVQLALLKLHGTFWKTK